MKKKSIKISKKKMLKEHRILVRILDKGTIVERKREAKKQRKEMKEYR